MGKDRTVWIDCKVVRTTPGSSGAVLIETDEEEQHWIPRSQIEDFDADEFDELDDNSHGHDCKLEITTWIAEQKGLA